jgi:hypothetical protein
MYAIADLEGLSLSDVSFTYDDRQATRHLGSAGSTDINRAESDS